MGQCEGNRDVVQETNIRFSFKALDDIVEEEAAETKSYRGNAVGGNPTPPPKVAQENTMPSKPEPKPDSSRSTEGEASANPPRPRGVSFHKSVTAGQREDPSAESARDGDTGDRVHGIVDEEPPVKEGNATSPKPTVTAGEQPKPAHDSHTTEAGSPTNNDCVESRRRLAQEARACCLAARRRDLKHDVQAFVTQVNGVDMNAATPSLRVLHHRSLADAASMAAKNVDAMSPDELTLHRRRMTCGSRALAALMEKIEEQQRNDRLCR